MVPLTVSLLVLLPLTGGGWLGLAFGYGVLPMHAQAVSSTAPSTPSGSPASAR